MNNTLLKALVRDPFWGVRREAAYALGRLGVSAAYKPVREVAMDETEDSTVRVAAIRALVALQGREALEAVLALRRSPSREVREEAHQAGERLQQRP